MGVCTIGPIKFHGSVPLVHSMENTIVLFIVITSPGYLD